MSNNQSSFKKVKKSPFIWTCFQFSNKEAIQRDLNESPY